MKILVIDTATPIELIALSVDDSVFSISEKVNISHSVTLFNNIETLLKQGNISIHDIDLFAVGTGPGSFTGLRIAVSTMRALAQVTRTPLLGLPTHELFAASVEARRGEQILVAFDAKKKRVFGAVYAKGDDTQPLIELIEPGDYSMEQLTDKMNPGIKTYSLGDGAQKYYDTLAEKLTHHDFLDNFLPSAERACELAVKAEPSDYLRVVPRYARKSDAEVARELKMKSLHKQ